MPECLEWVINGIESERGLEDRYGNLSFISRPCMYDRLEVGSQKAGFPLDSQLFGICLDRKTAMSRRKSSSKKIILERY